jgi:transcriptional regulator with XRE-family HTH domain
MTASDPQGKERPPVKPLSARQALVGSVLRDYRQAAGYKLDDAARILECDRSKISRIETGQRGIRAKEFRELLTEYGVDDATQDTLVTISRPRNANGWWKGYRQALSPAYLDFVVAESVASRIWVYAPLQVPEPLWTPVYGQAVTAADPAIPHDAERIVVEAAIEHHGGTLFHRQPEVTVILGEAALRQQIGVPAVMRAQFAHLAALAGPDYPWLNIRIVPFAGRTHAADGSGAYSILRFDQTPDLGIVYLPGPNGGLCLTDPPAVDAYARAFEQTAEYSLTPGKSAAKLRQLAQG